MSDPHMVFDDPTVFTVDDANKTRESIIDCGGKEGKNNRPPTDATEPDQFEKAIVHTYRKSLEVLLNGVAKRLRELRDLALAQRDKVPDEADIINIVDDELPKDVDKALEHVTTDLTKLLKDEGDAGRELRLFQLQKGLNRRARYPESQWKHFSVAGVIVILESAFNMFFFAQGSDLGLLGGFFQAVTVSLANVGTAVAIGHFCLPHMNVKAHRSVMIAVLVLYVAFLLFFNLAVAHYRDLLAVSADSTALQSVAKLFEHPFDLSFHSLLLFVIGLLAAGFGMYKGFTSDDPYPGYSKVDRQYRAAADRVEKFEKGLTAQIQALCDRVEPAINQAIQAGEAALRAITQLLTEARSAKDGCEAERNRGLDKFRQFLKAYRDANVFVRDAGNPPPAYFAKYDQLDGLVLDSKPVGEIETLINEGSAALAQAKTRAATARNQDQQRHEREIKKMRDKIEAIRKKASPDSVPGSTTGAGA